MHLLENVPLAPRTTFRIGGPARWLAEVRTEDDLTEALAFATTRNLPLFALGGGSNLLIPDGGFDGLVLHLDLQGSLERTGNLVDVPAGTDWDFLVRTLCEQNLCGMECLAGIPGLAGASPIQNIGAYGQEAAETIHTVRAYDRHTRQFVTLPREACRFAYRSSLFNTTARNRYFITRVTFALDPAARPNLTYADLRAHFAGNPNPTPLEVYTAVREIRRAKGMILLPDGAEGVDDTRSAGSFFKNPIVPASVVGTIAEALALPEESIPRYPAPGGMVKLPAAWLLERAGFHRAFAMGQAGISSRHTLALINRGNARYADLARLRDHIVATVQARFHLTLEQEPVEPS